MLPEVERFGKWLRRRNPDATTPVHYTSDLELFFTWLDKPLTQVSVTRVCARRNCMCTSLIPMCKPVTKLR